MQKKFLAMAVHRLITVEFNAFQGRKPPGTFK
jgi:hypothetical protein